MRLDSCRACSPSPASHPFLWDCGMETVERASPNAFCPLLFCLLFRFSFASFLMWFAMIYTHALGFCSSNEHVPVRALHIVSESRSPHEMPCLLRCIRRKHNDDCNISYNELGRVIALNHGLATHNPRREWCLASIHN